MKKIIYLPQCSALNVYAENDEGTPTYDSKQAVREARRMLAYTTGSERQTVHVYVGVYTVDTPDDDPRTAAQIYSDMLDDDTWPSDHDVIEISVITANGDVIDYANAVALMDDDIREQLHDQLAPCTDQAFFSAYEKAHEAKHGVPFALN